MRAWAVVENGAPLEEITCADPVPNGTEVVIAVTHCGVCHTDLHMWEGYYDLGGGRRMSIKDRGVTLPLTLGHEIVGKVVSFGPEASGVSIGDERVVFPWVGCGHCDRCLAEEDQMCVEGRALGIIQNGGYGSHVVVPSSRHLIPLEGVSPSVAATLACSGITAYSAVKKVLPLPPQEPVVIIGAGALGLTAISLLRALGHRNIVIVDINHDRLSTAKLLGASASLRAEGNDVTARLVSLCSKNPLAIVDLVNDSRTAKFSFDALGKGGKLVQVGLFGGELSLPLPLMAMKALTVQGSYVGSPRELRELVSLVSKGGVLPIPVEDLPISKVNAALSRLKNGEVTGRLILRHRADKGCAC
ncbi:alcohol dehydrogenase [Tardiphaga sp. 215_C5_N2_1]|uniref:alcohol dehydrogenase n=1 Tax=Tardiphaga sp. 215_C5_N2_1 TaxID=3240774 RepID=UPI003F8AC576